MTDRHTTMNILYQFDEAYSPYAGVSLTSLFINHADLTILALQYPDSGKLSTDVPDMDTGIDWLVYLAQYSLQCQAQSRLVVRSRLDIVENTEIMAGPYQSFYCGTL